MLCEKKRKAEENGRRDLSYSWQDMLFHTDPREYQPVFTDWAGIQKA